MSQSRPSLLDSVLLGAVAERPGYGYELGKRLESRMGPTWKFNISGIYAALDKLEDRHLVTHDQRERARSVRTRGRVVYRVTDAGVAALENWLRAPVRKEPVRMDVLARLAVSQPEHAPLLLDALASYERECMDLLTSTNAHAPDQLHTWDRLMAEGLRDQALKHLGAEIGWIKSMRLRIEAFVDTGRR